MFDFKKASIEATKAAKRAAIAGVSPKEEITAIVAKLLKTEYDTRFDKIRENNGLSMDDRKDFVINEVNYGLSLDYMEAMQTTLSGLASIFQTVASDLGIKLPPFRIDRNSQVKTAFAFNREQIRLNKKLENDSELKTVSLFFNRSKIKELTDVSLTSHFVIGVIDYQKKFDINKNPITDSLKGLLQSIGFKVVKEGYNFEIGVSDPNLVENFAKKHNISTEILTEYDIILPEIKKASAKKKQLSKRYYCSCGVTINVRSPGEVPLDYEFPRQIPCPACDKGMFDKNQVDVTNSDEIIKQLLEP
jgi:hypothetical protein